MSPLAVLDGAGWRLVFEQYGDRVRHQIEVEEAGAWRTLIESIEGQASQWWPPSPPLQSLHLESRSSGNVALLVGMSGRSHWSASIEMADDRAEAVFDIACRVTETPEWLGSQYQAAVLQPVEATLDSWRVGLHEIRFRALDPAPLRMAQEGPGRLEICPVLGPHRWPQTVRWRYAARVQHAPGQPRG